MSADTACPDPSHVYAVLHDGPGRVLVELGGCNRVLRADGTLGRLPGPSTVLTAG